MRTASMKTRPHNGSRRGGCSGLACLFGGPHQPWQANEQFHDRLATMAAQRLEKCESRSGWFKTAIVMVLDPN